MKDGKHITGLRIIETVDYNGSIEASQHCIELSIKALYALVGLNPPKKHDAAVELQKIIEKLEFPDSLVVLRDRLARMKWISKMWEWAHSTSVYGYLDIPATRLFKKEDAEIAAKYADEVLMNCRSIADLVENEEIKIKTQLKKEV